MNQLETLTIGEVATRDYLRSELRSLLAELDERTGDEAADHDDAALAKPRNLES